ncbi:MAG: SMC family ATPase, partial [Chloroflexi bacterium]|nr:SMC family ATPase [Chloroflexota bacterium]
LYSPSTIKAAEVKPRVWRGKTEVHVILDDPETGTQYTVERELGTGSAKARIYKLGADGIEEKIVDGAAQVTAYVTDHLIGLEHAAFVATFFTRQKELGFFNGSPTTRRRDVGKLLGLETIRDAQQIIAEDRKRAVADARSYRNLSEDSQKDRDFPAEITSAEETIATHKQALETTTGVVSAANTASETARSALTAIETLRDQDAALEKQISTRQRDHDLAAQQSANAARELERLAREEANREKLVPIANTLPQLQQDETALLSTRQSALRKRELERELTALNRNDEDRATQIREAIAGAPAPDGSQSWTAENPEQAVSWAGGIELRSLEERAAGIATAVETAEQFNTESQRLGKFHERVNELIAVQKSLVEEGDPAQKLREIDEEISQFNASTAAAESSDKRIYADLQKSERVLNNLRTQQEGEICPTCQRPFTADDTSHVVQVFERDIASYQQQLQAIRQQIAANGEAISKKQSDRKSFAEAVTKLTETNASLENGKRYVEEQQARVDGLSARLSEVLQSLGRTEPPTVQDRDVAQRELIAWRKVVDAAAIVTKAHQSRGLIAKERAPIEQELTSLAEISYDEAAHRDITEKLQQARQAQANIDRITAELAQRDDVIQTQSGADEIVVSAKSDVATLNQQRTELGFDVTAFQAAQADVQAAQQRERAAIDERHRAEVALNNAGHALNSIKAEQERVGKLALQAEAKQREADDLDLMYKEFTEFERYAAAWYAPRLSEITSELVSQVTDGKYDRVEFDNNFSIQVFDGDDEKYPYETFSGGERDAIALCARIALSRVIGGASANPPEFLVLDEVFGSLDLERRQRLLEMLGAITGADDHFRQVFIISHVDDVRTSPVLDDIWRVVETEGGTSELQMLGAGVDIGEL